MNHSKIRLFIFLIFAGVLCSFTSCKNQAKNKSGIVYQHKRMMRQRIFLSYCSYLHFIFFFKYQATCIELRIQFGKLLVWIGLQILLSKTLSCYVSSSSWLHIQFKDINNTQESLSTFPWLFLLLWYWRSVIPSKNTLNPLTLFQGRSFAQRLDTLWGQLVFISSF